MKKNILSLAVLALGFSAAYAQTGHVGINTTTPSETLHIKGTFKLEDPGPHTAVDGYVLTSTSTGVGQWKPLPSTASPAVSSLTTNGTSGVATLVSGTLNIPNYTYTLPIATTTLGGVKNGGNVTINNDGTMSAPASGSATAVNVTAPITNTGTPTAPVIGIAKNDLASGGTSSSSASSPLTVANGTGAVINGLNTTLTVNNTAPLWNANQLNGTTVNGTPTNGQVLTYNGTTWAPATTAAGGVTSVTGTSPIAVTGTASAPVVGLNRNNIVSGTSSASATSALTLDAGATNAVVGGANATLTVNNTAALWNAKQINGTNVSGTPSAGQVLQYNNSTSQYEPTSLPAASNDWKITGNTGTVAPAALGSASTNFVGTTDNQSLALSTNNLTRAVLDTNGTLIGGGSSTSSLAWGSGNNFTSTTTTTNPAIALGLNNSVENPSIAVASVGIGTSNTVTGGGYAFGRQNTVGGSLGVGVGYNNTIAFNGYAFGAGNNTAGYSFGSGNTGIKNTVTIGITTTASNEGESVYGNTKHLFYGQSNATTTNVGINVPVTFASADLTVKSTIKIGAATKTMCDALIVGTIVYEEASNVGTFYGCKKTGAGTYGWQAL